MERWAWFHFAAYCQTFSCFPLHTLDKFHAFYDSSQTVSTSVAVIACFLPSGSYEIEQDNDDRDGNYQPGICRHLLKDA
jgi:hypothetical protein